MILRPVSLADAPMLLDWYNDPAVRDNSSDPTLRELDEHCDWIVQRIRPDRPYAGRSGFYVAVDADRSIGMGRIETNATQNMYSCYVSYSVAADFRGLGYGKRLASLLVLTANAMEYHTVKARIKRGNMCSVAVAIQCGITTIELF